MTAPFVTNAVTFEDALLRRNRRRTVAMWETLFERWPPCEHTVWTIHGAVGCGLLTRHSGPCLPYTPGAYLLPPLADPLEILLNRCQVCGAAIDHWLLSWKGCDPWYTWVEARPCRCVVRIEGVQQWP